MVSVGGVQDSWAVGDAKSGEAHPRDEEGGFASDPVNQPGGGGENGGEMLKSK